MSAPGSKEMVRVAFQGATIDVPKSMGWLENTVKEAERAPIFANPQFANYAERTVLAMLFSGDKAQHEAAMKMIQQGGAETVFQNSEAAKYESERPVR